MRRRIRTSAVFSKSQGVRAALLTLFALSWGLCSSKSLAEEERIYTLLILGDSLTAGLGVAEDQAWPTRLESIAAAEGVKLKTINGGLSGDTSAGGRRRLAWLLRQPIDGFFVALGANDGLRGLDLKMTEENLTAILDEVHAKHPAADLFLAGMKLPPNFGAAYTAEFEKLFGRIAEKKDVVHIPFLLEGVAGEPALNQPDKLHPNEEGYRVIAQHVWRFVKPRVARRHERRRRVEGQSSSRHFSPG